MGSSTILRRWISGNGSVGISRSRGISSADYFSCFSNSFCSRESDANRMMSTATSGGVTTPDLPSAPWLMLPPAVDNFGNIAYKFHCLAKKEEFHHRSRTGDGGQLPANVDIIRDIEFVGSSHGWIALYNRQNSDLFLSNPITDGHVKLPPLRSLGAPDRVILSSSLANDDEEEDEPRALMTFLMTLGSRRRLALCSPRRSNEWTLFGGDHEYDNVVYSSRHKRLFCVCEKYIPKKDTKTSLESWNVGESPPTLDWAIEGNKVIDFGDYYHTWPNLSDLKKECLQMKYLVCAEHSGELFLVVRHVNLRAGPYGALEDKIILSRYRGWHYIRTPYKTIDFDVYKIDIERGEVKHMEDSLEGLAMFVGINQPFAIPAADVAGLKPDCLYFTDENRVVKPTKLERTSYGGHDNGIFDYKNNQFYSCCNFYPIEFEKIRKILPLPLWFTPTTTIN